MEMIEKQKYIFGSIFLLANKLQVLGDQYLTKEDLTTKQWLLTVMISQFQSPPTLSEVAEMMGSSRQNVKQLALKLQEKEFLKIEKDEQDARALRLKLTEKSKAFWKNREEIDGKFVAELFKDMAKDNIDAFYNGIRGLSERVEKMGKPLFKSL